MNGGGTITIINKIKQIFQDELEICNIRKIATYEYEIDTIGYNYYTGYKLPIGTFSLMNDYGMQNIRIMNSKKIKDSYCITIRFIINTEQLEEKLQEDKEWRERWEQLQKKRNTS